MGHRGAVDEQATLVPITALVRRGGKEGVFLVENGGSQEAALQTRFVPVATGIIHGEIAEVLEPSLSGMIVTLGNHLLEDGAKVILPKTSSDEFKTTGDGSEQGGRS